MLESNNLQVNNDLYELSELEIVDNANYKMTESLKKEKNTLFNEYANFKVEKELNKMNTRGSNTDPNNAYLIETEVIYSDYIEVENQQKWHGMIVNDNAKLTAILENSSELNSNIALFKLDEPTMTLNLVSYAINSNSSKKLDYVGEQGIYYLLVEGYSGVGKFNFAVFETNNIINEPNDNINQSIQIEENTPIKGTIDNMFDIDLYKANYNSPRILSISIDNLDYFVKFNTNWFGSKNLDKALILTLCNTDMYVRRTGRGAYSENYTFESPYTILVIDTDTKKVVDVMYPNYYYLYGNQRFYYTNHPSEYSELIKYWGRN